MIEFVRANWPAVVVWCVCLVAVVACVAMASSALDKTHRRSEADRVLSRSLGPLHSTLYIRKLHRSRPHVEPPVTIPNGEDKTK